MTNHAGGISIIAFVIAVGISMGYYQYMYVPAVNAKPILPPAVLNPPETLTVKITPGSSVESNPKFFEPKDMRSAIGLNNHIIWQNNDQVPHSVTSDDGYIDKINGKFDTLATIGLIPGGETWEFTITAVGTYHYHCEPHPWMQGSIEVTESFA
ncbi:cupredoxin domain-containing protein [Nitrososphaera viennensis]|uniref:Plastocyanin/azurin family copper-binding protein n=2 Tax=Nitrososphaera viennensis TaxID=1034015 RepID=A0A977NMI1_9ARCH|nr:plastocyanin/azurin family copper-binding protein [Nitrososphaera viennensis]AIC14446.1 putative blue (type1) copper domain-containing protein [Nitrososphaera viennensis EN76]UVS69426.1 plastocyanin/azurin family copper-binding protein [Nitrososphaera viennensis]